MGSSTTTKLRPGNGNSPLPPCSPSGLVDAFSAWLTRTLREQVLLPTNPFTKAAHYVLEREASLQIFLECPNVPLDINHLEREIHPIALGRKNWLFCRTELGARYVGLVSPTGC